jgi:hypothetical protein
MIRWNLTLVLLGVACVGCARSYRVHVNGYSEPGRQVASGTSIYVATDPNSQNPILERRIKTKLTALLQGYGYVPRAERAAARYWLDFQVGTNSETVVGYTPVYGYYGGYRGGHYRGYGIGYTTYLPYSDTRYNQWLAMRLHASDSPDSNDVTWVGEAVMSTSQVELREAVDFLLVGCVEFLGVDTGESVTLTIRKDDPRVLSLDAISASETPQ